MSSNAETLTPPTAEERRRARRAVLAAGTGNALEWFDIIVYASFSSVISRVFFPTSEGATGLILTFGIFAVSYLARPVGAIFLGRYADRAGRKAALTLTIGIMTLGVGLMAVAPTHASIGAAAAGLLILARLLQGFSAGGEFGSATAFLTESTRRGKAFLGSWQVATQGVALLLAGSFGFALFGTLSPEALQSWGWRVPFFFGLLIGPVGIWIRRSMDDTPEFAATEPLTLGNFVRTFGHNVGRVLTAAICVGAATISIYLVSYLPTFSINNLGLPSWAGFLGNIVAGITLFVLSPLVGLLADRVGCTKVMLVAAVVGALAIYPMFALITSSPSVLTLTLVQLVLGVIMSAYFAPLPALMSQMFPTQIRSTGLALSYNIGVTAFGGFAGAIFTALISSTGVLESPAFYYMGICVLSLVGLVLARKAYGQR
ncbi:MFS transporter [Auraticoccus sp. F435]|uniref:MFS transporter n=1 Tax=Auraticoccus cholistanensis TaxID=2656650 RepID=A0A6A9V059_9ACTN|nr:MFS transporter [Auraticoccus cholistanensis]MVA75029.1 MFS transporter [Auraticoccus cholistanensis]